MTSSNTSLELKLSVNLKQKEIDIEREQKKVCILSINKPDETDFEESVKKSIFWEMYLKRKAGMEIMNCTLEDLVKECMFWKQQLDGLSYTNGLLDAERHSLRRDYEELCEKTRHDTGIMMKLKDSQKILREETMEYFKTDQNLTNVHSINTDLASDRMLLESRKNQLLKRLKENNIDFKRINNVHKRIQSRIEKEKRRGEDNSTRYKEELKKLQNTINADNETFEIFKKNLLNRELLIDDVKNLLTDGIKNYTNGDQKEEEESEVSDAAEENDTSETTSQLQVSTDEKSGESENESETEAPVEKKAAKKKAPEKSKSIENELMIELRKRKLLHQIAQEENVLLTKYYQYLNSRMKNMNELYMEQSHYHNFKETELRRYMMKASDLYQLVTRKIRRYVIPPRNPADDLKMSIESRMSENERMRDFITQYVAYIEEDLEFDASFKDNAKEFYKNLILQEAPEIEIPEEKSPDEPDKGLVPDETEEQAAE